MNLALGRMPAMAGDFDEEEEDEDAAEPLLVVVVLLLLKAAGGVGRLVEAAEVMGPCAGVSTRACFAISTSKPR